MILADLFDRLGPVLVVVLVGALGWWAHRTQRRQDDADARDPNVLAFHRRVAKRYDGSERPPAA